MKWCVAISLLLIAKSASLSAEVCQLDGQWYDPNYSTRNAQVKKIANKRVCVQRFVGLIWRIKIFPCL